jgi:hypothetical protein
VTAKPLPLVSLSPLGVTALLVVWTILVSPHSKYGDSWAIDPALIALPLVIGLHVLVAYQAPAGTQLPPPVGGSNSSTLMP